MPLVKSTSKGAIYQNAKREMDAGKPRAQAFAIAYSVRRRLKKKSGG